MICCSSFDKNYLRGRILYRTLVPPKKRRDSLLDGLFDLNVDKIKNLTEIHEELKLYFGAFRCPEDNPECQDGEKIEGLFVDGGMVS